MDAVDTWLAALIERHTAPWSRAEFLKAARALSARYVGDRGPAGRPAPTDSPAKRAAFAALFAPLHFFAAREVAARLDLADAGIEMIVDLGCGTGVVSAALALACDHTPTIMGVDRDAWALDEARWTWSALGLRAHARRSDLLRAAGALATRRPTAGPGTAVVLGWTVNELPAESRTQLRRVLEGLAARGTALLVIEPISRRVSPWWDQWTAALDGPRTRCDEWAFDLALPAVLANLDRDAGFRREQIKARTIWVGRT